MTDHTLMGTTDAMVWAEEFCRIFDGYDIRKEELAERTTPCVDPGTMVGWFANAMAVAEREATQKLCPHPTTERSELSEDLVTCVRCGKIWSRS